jgi:hypothetical protein
MVNGCFGPYNEISYNHMYALREYAVNKDFNTRERKEKWNQMRVFEVAVRENGFTCVLSHLTVGRYFTSVPRFCTSNILCFLK